MAKHQWVRDEFGDIDVFQLEFGHHNGPRCAVCDEAFCHHCDPERYDEECEQIIDGQVVVAEIESGHSVRPAHQDSESEGGDR